MARALFLIPPERIPCRIQRGAGRTVSSFVTSSSCGCGVVGSIIATHSQPGLWKHRKRSQAGLLGMGFYSRPVSGERGPPVDEVERQEFR